MLSAVIVGAIAVAIALGYKTKINTGFFAIAFAYLIGCFGMSLKTKAIISMWPVSVMFVIFAVSIFYNFALVNGTLEKMSKYLLYSCRKFPGLLPFALFFVATILAAIGAGYFTVLAFMAPVTLLICDEAKMDKVVGAVAVNCGALVGGNFMTSNLGVIFIGLIRDVIGKEAVSVAVDPFNISFTIFVCSMIFALIFIACLRYIPKANRNIGKGVTFAKPEPLNPKQKTNLRLMLAMMFVVLIFPIMHIILPQVKVISMINSRIDVGLVAIIFSIIALLLDLAPQKEVIAKVPWNTIIMICGVGMLIQVAIKAGTIKLLAAWIGSNIPAAFVPIAFSIVAAFMSFFSSTTGVVCPALFPLIPSLSTSLGIHPAILFVCTVLGAQSSAISPFSSGGSLILGGCSREEERTGMFHRLLFVAVPSSIVCAMIFNFVVSMLM